MNVMCVAGLLSMALEDLLKARGLGEYVKKLVDEAQMTTKDLVQGDEKADARLFEEIGATTELHQRKFRSMLPNCVQKVSLHCGFIAVCVACLLCARLYCYNLLIFRHLLAQNALFWPRLSAVFVCVHFEVDFVPILRGCIVCRPCCFGFCSFTHSHDGIPWFSCTILVFAFAVGVWFDRFDCGPLHAEYRRFAHIFVSVFLVCELVALYSACVRIATLGFCWFLARFGVLCWFLAWLAVRVELW